MITANVLSRVFFIKAQEYGTAFVIDHEDLQYLVTARHLIDPENQRSIRFFLNKKWIDLPVTLTGIGQGEVDLAVFRVSALLCPKRLPLPASTNEIVIGQDVYFVGFPYKMWTDAGAVMAGRPCPFIKKGTLSSAFTSDDGVSRIYIDAINNEGFSGGPIVFHTRGNNNYRVAGVVSKFKIEYERVIDPIGGHTEMTVAYNTGFLIGYDISNAIEIIGANPNGFPIPAQV
jgi:S1-C subfamily serine protease